MKSLRMVLQLREPPYPKASFGRNFFQWIAVAGIVATCFSISAGAQGGQSRPTFPGTTPPGFTSGVAISGVVTQADRAAGGASVQIQNRTTGMTAQAVTRADGSFEFSNLLPGEYVVTSTLGTDRVQNQVSL